MPSLNKYCAKCNAFVDINHKCKSADLAMNNRIYDKFYRNKESSKFYHSKSWKNLRNEVIKEQPFCVMCGKAAAIIDHIKPILAGGERLDKSNLQPLCRACHNAKTIKERKEK